MKKDEKQLKTLSDYSPVEYETLYKRKVKITRNNLLFAEECWRLFVENKKEALKEFDFSQCSKFMYLQKAIDQHLERYPSQNGLNQIENKILETINLGISDRNTIIKEMLLWQQNETVYGFGDLQYFLYLKKLINYYSVKNERITLNAKGKDLLFRK